MAISDDVASAVHNITASAWAPRRGTVVPEVDRVALTGDVVEIEGTVLFADLAQSTMLIRDHLPQFAAQVVRIFLNVASRAIRFHSGEIRSFDGDRVMAVFMGERHVTNAVRAGLLLNGLMKNIAIPRLHQRWNFITPYRVGYASGIDCSTIFVIRAGIRDNNDLVFMGYGTNIAAKLSQMRIPGVTTLISDRVFMRLILSGDNLLSNNLGLSVWHQLYQTHPSDHIYGSDNYFLA